MTQIASTRILTLEDRVTAQRAIEEVYWLHRTWPRENRGPKPRLSEVFPETAIRAKVEDYLRKSNALAVWWKRPVTPEQLQAELDRMARDTRDPGVLRELHAALGGDSFLIAETLARQSLADRLIRDWYTFDERFHGDARRQAETELASMQPGTGPFESASGRVSTTTFVRRVAAVPPGGGTADELAVELDSDDWRQWLDHTARLFRVDTSAIPIGRLSELQEDGNGFYAMAVSSLDADTANVTTIAWPKRPFDSWWSAQQVTIGPDLEIPAREYLATVRPTAPCVDDTWRGRIYSAAGRHSHTVVWTGTEMIVWGGIAFSNSLASGARYNPATDTWVAVSSGANQPAPRYAHTAVWTGTEMIVWGGRVGNSYSTSGGRYDPVTDTWTATFDGAGVPEARGYHSSVWTGAEMIVWGGYTINHGYSSAGARYNPVSDSWVPTSQGAGVPPPRYGHSAFWTGSEMIVWGGYNASATLTSGGRYSPSTDSWAPTSVGANLPAARWNYTAVWTGAEMIVWGGLGTDWFNTGARYNPLTDSWTPTSTGADVPAARTGHAAAWTGSEMIIWGGEGGIGVNAGGRYSPSSDRWTPMSTASSPFPRSNPTALWTGSEVIVWGGGSTYSTFGTGGRYNPSSDSWVPTAVDAPAPTARYRHTAVWTGTEMIVWGGEPGPPTRSGGRYNPATDEWKPTSEGAGVPYPRSLHTAIWTGTEMIVYGGYSSYDGSTFTGARYNPMTDSWVATSGGEYLPARRYRHTAVWTGTEMIVWGGSVSPSFNPGARYNPTTDSWAPTSTVEAPSTTTGHTAVWTGREMIISGANGWVIPYDPVLDQWQYHTSGDALPYSSAVWTGTEMIQWGGMRNDTPVGGGGRYNPATRDWTPIPYNGVLAPRAGHVAVWTGAEMIVWGGSYLNTGGRYDPWARTWTATYADPVTPFLRSESTAVWTGTEMIVWGGRPFTSELWSYCACAAVAFRDSDGDGFGDLGDVAPTLDCAAPAGYVVQGYDCDDSAPEVHPGAIETYYNGIDDDCDPLTIDDDIDRDGYGIADDCNDANYWVHHIPSEVAGVEVGLEGALVTLNWVSQSASAGGTYYEMVTGNLSALRSAANYGAAECLGVDGPPGYDRRSGPPAGEGYYYLVRALNACGIASFGDSTVSPADPRDALDGASPCSFSVGRVPTAPAP